VRRHVSWFWWSQRHRRVGGRDAKEFAFIDEKVEILAITEHDRSNRECRADGWTLETRTLRRRRLRSGAVRGAGELSRRGPNDLGLDDVVPEQAQRLDSVQYISDLRRVGQAAARDVAMEHFAGFLGTAR
jgi:hypothetical protein